MGVVFSTSHLIELADGTNNCSRIVLFQRLTSRSHQRLDRPRQQLLPVDDALIDVELDLLSGPLDELVAQHSGDPTSFGGKDG